MTDADIIRLSFIGGIAGTITILAAALILRALWRMYIAPKIDPPERLEADLRLLENARKYYGDKEE